MYNQIAYAIYLTLGSVIILFVGKSLYKNGYPLIVDLFHNERLAKTISNMLLVGYYLVNIGYLAITIIRFEPLHTIQSVWVALSTNIGIILTILGILHFNNILILLFLGRRKHKLIQPHIT